MPDPYETLGVEPDATPGEIRAAFREKVRASHPDTSTDSGGESDVIAVVDAYRRLMGDAGRRATNLEGDGPDSVRRVEVRRKGRTDPVRPARCVGCGGLGVVMAWSECPGCRGTGAITRLDLPRARVVVCPRCRGRAGIERRVECTSCGGSGTMETASRE